jgi:hypothetical protein
VPSRRLGPDRRDLADEFVAQDERVAHAEVALEEVDVGGADPAQHNAHQQVLGPGLGQRHRVGLKPAFGGQHDAARRRHAAVPVKW